MIFAAFVLIACALLAAPSAKVPAYVADESGPFEGIPDSPVKITFLGTSTLLLEDGHTNLMIDGFFTRPSKWRVMFGQLKTDEAKVRDALDRLGITKLAAVLVTHSHYDHAMDSAHVADTKGAILVGSQSTWRIGEGAGLKEKRFQPLEPGLPQCFGDFTVVAYDSIHSPAIPGINDDLGEIIPGKVEQPADKSDYKEGGSYDLLIKHGELSILVKATAGFGAGLLNGVRAQIIFLGAGTLGHQEPTYREDYYRETVETVGARVVVPVHWDDFTRPLTEDLPAMPHIADDVSAGLEFLKTRTYQQGRKLILLQGFQMLSMNGQVCTRRVNAAGRLICESTQRGESR